MIEPLTAEEIEFCERRRDVSLLEIRLLETIRARDQKIAVRKAELERLTKERTRDLDNCSESWKLHEEYAVNAAIRDCADICRNTVAGGACLRAIQHKYPEAFE